MSEIVIVNDEPTPDEATIPVDEAVDLIDSAIEHVADAISESNAGEGVHDDNMAFVAGVTIAALDALTGRLEVVETRLDALTPVVAEVVETVEEVVESVAVEPVIVEEPQPEPDEAPDTWRTKLNRAWFGKGE